MFLFSAVAGLLNLSADDTGAVTIRPIEYTSALKNPLMGFRGNSPQHPFGSLQKTYIRWSDLEDKETDGVDKIRKYCDEIWKDFPKNNVKAIPRVWLLYPNKPDAWPSDMQKGDFSSQQFKDRVVKLVKKLGECWDNDPRVAFVEMGIIGKWGEQHSPDISEEMQKILAPAFDSAFKNKLIMIRHAKDFPNSNYGIYWDSWAHQDQMNWKEGGGIGIAGLGDRWKTAVIGGETAYDWGKYKIQPGDNPNDTLTDPVHLSFLIDSIYSLHCNHLGWIADYDINDPKVKLGASEVQMAFGYRFVIEEVTYPSMISKNKKFSVSFIVKNKGASPFYYNWPVELSLLDPKTREVAWKGLFKDLDIRKWMPGDKWNEEKKAYDIEPKPYKTEGELTLPESIPDGEYILALSILDPAGMLPSARFAIKNYFKGGRHPIGMIGVGKTPTNAKIDPAIFDKLSEDTTLHYFYKAEK